MKRTFSLTDRFTVGEYTIEYANFNILIKKGGSLVKCIDAKRDFNNIDYGKFVEKFESKYSNKK
jgi:hypothetical protein